MDDIIYANGNWEDDNSFAFSDELADLVQRLHSILLATLENIHHTLSPEKRSFSPSSTH